MSKDFCHDCGICCMHMRTPPFIGTTDPRWRAMPQDLRDGLLNWIRWDEARKQIVTNPRYDYLTEHHGEDAPCIWLDVVTGKCRHYEWRPDVCRDYEVGCGPCRDNRKAVGLTIEGMPVVEEPLSPAPTEQKP